MKNRFLTLLISVIFAVLFSACGGGGGGSDKSSVDTISSEVIDSTDVTSPVNNVNEKDEDSGSIQDINFVVYKSVALETDPFVKAQCKDLGGIAIYSGVDANKNSLLDEEERVGDPQVVCNGASGDKANFSAKDIAVGSEQCPLGGIEFITSSSSVYICNNEVKSSSSDNSLKFSKSSTIKGSIEGVTIKKAQGRVKKANALTSQEGGLWLTADKLRSAIAEDKKERSSSSTLAIPTSITKPIKIEIDENNNYEIADVPSGEYSLVYIDEEKKEGIKLDNIFVISNTTLTQNIDATKFKATGSVILNVHSLLFSYSLKGVKIRLNELDKLVVTDKDGKASFTNLPEGSYSLTISKDGYVAKYISFNIESGKETDLKTVEINSQKGSLVGSVEADVVDDFANIIVYIKSVDGSVYRTLTDSNGNYTFNALPIGEGYSLIAYAHDFESSKVDNITIRDTQTSSANKIFLTKYQSVTGSISGFVRFADVTTSLNHAGIIVSVEGTDLEAITSRDGSFVLNNLIAGKYTLNFSDSNHITQTKTITIVDSSTIYVDRLSLVPKTGNLKGKIVDELGQGVANTTIILSTSSQTITTVTDSNGTYTLNGILAGTHEVVASKDGYGGGSTLVTIVENKMTDISKSSSIVLSRKVLTGKINLQNIET